MARTTSSLKWLLWVVASAAFLLVFHHYSPLQPAVVTFWAGACLALAGVLSLIRPLRWLGVRSRRAAAVVTLAGAAVAVAALSWPVATLHASGPHQRLDDFMADYQFYETHETVVDATPDQVARALREVSMADMPAAVLLMRIRAMAAGHFATPRVPATPILDMFSHPRSAFLVLDGNTPGEWVGGMVGRPWAGGPPSGVHTPEQFLAFRTPDNVRVAFNMRWTVDGAGRTRLTTETRIAGTDAAATKTFARYWRVIYPGSAIIRRVWLDAIVARAEHGA
jgi:hypothetical protein